MTKSNRTFYILGVLLVVTIIATILHNPKSPGTKAGTSSIDTLPVFAVETFKTETGWGYDIFIDNKKYFHQNVIPAIGGNVPFSSQNDALKCGQLVLKKLKSKQMPAISKHELDSLQIVPRH